MKALSCKFQTSAPSLESCPVSDLPEFAFIGRSNVGKSSLLNVLAGTKELAKVSATPGHTKLINFFPTSHAWSLVDLPGYGYAKGARAEADAFQQMIAGYLTGRENLACVFVLIDSRHPPQGIDLEFVEWLLRESVPFALVFSKADTVSAGALKKNIALFEGKVAAWCGELPRVFATSAKTGHGRRDLLDYIAETLGGLTSVS
ncbi:MAG: ribosome biogenesis GTP-binding protein YihA/YsxC [Chthoniobacteraceae bacterium]